MSPVLPASAKTPPKPVVGTAREPLKLEGEHRFTATIGGKLRSVTDLAKKDFADAGIKPTPQQIVDRVADYGTLNAHRFGNISDVVPGDVFIAPIPVAKAAPRKEAGTPAQALAQNAALDEAKKAEAERGLPGLKKAVEAWLQNVDQFGASANDKMQMAQGYLKQPAAELLPADTRAKLQAIGHPPVTAENLAGLHGRWNNLSEVGEGEVGTDGKKLSSAERADLRKSTEASLNKATELALDANKHLAGTAEYAGLESLVGRPISLKPGQAAAAPEAAPAPGRTQQGGGKLTNAQQAVADAQADDRLHNRQANQKAAATQVAQTASKAEVGEAVAQLNANPEGDVKKLALKGILERTKEAGVTGPDVDLLTTALNSSNPPDVKRAEKNVKSMIEHLQQDPYAPLGARGLPYSSAIAKAKQQGVKLSAEDQKWVDFATSKINGATADAPKSAAFERATGQVGKEATALPEHGNISPSKRAELAELVKAAQTAGVTGENLEKIKTALSRPNPRDQDAALADVMARVRKLQASPSLALRTDWVAETKTLLKKAEGIKALPTEAGDDKTAIDNLRALTQKMYPDKKA